MKKLILLIVIIVSTNILLSQVDFDYNDYEHEMDSTEFQYRDGYREIEKIRQLWCDSLQEWVNNRRYTREYIDEVNASIIYCDKWIDEDWQNFYRIHHSYSDSLLTERLVELYDNNGWINSNIEYITYNEDNDMILLDSYYWQDEQWMDDGSHTWIYDNGNCTQEIIESIIAGNVSIIRYTYNYDIDNNMTSVIRESMDEYEWEYDYRITYIYENGLVRYSELCNFLLPTWILYSNNSYQYNTAGNLTERTYQEFIEEEWINQDRYVYEYDDSNNNIYSQVDFFQNNSWLITSTIDRVYDEHQNLMSEVCADWDDGQSTFSVRELYTYEVYTDVEEQEMKSTFFANHPNPFNPTTTITFDLSTEHFENTEIYIYNIKGQKVDVLSFDSAQDDSVVWNASEFASGVYFYKLNVKESPIKKMVLLK